MLKNIKSVPRDPILALSQLCQEDDRPSKIDAGVGIFVDPTGNTPVMRAVKIAEQRVWETQTTKKYQPVSGNPAFNRAIGKLILADIFDNTRMRVNQCAGGTGGLRVVAETLNTLQPQGAIWIPTPTWGNHLAIFGATAKTIKRYDYLDENTCEVARDKVFSLLETVNEKDSVLFHGCCHNPSGADFTQEDWKCIAEVANRIGFTPIIDLAYLGLGTSVDADAWGVRYIAKNVPQALIIVSCSKTFGLYSERAGAIISISCNAQEADALQSNLNAETRKLISMSSDHAAATVAIILDDATLHADWIAELNEMAEFIRSRRQKLQEALQDGSGKDWSFITRHRGMFTLLPLGEDNVRKLRDDYAIYLVGNGRINLTGLSNDEKIHYFCTAVNYILG